MFQPSCRELPLQKAQSDTRTKGINYHFGQLPLLSWSEPRSPPQWPHPAWWWLPGAQMEEHIINRREQRSPLPVLSSTLIHHNSPEAPCSSPAWQSSPTLPPAPPRSRPAAAAARGQSSSEPRCRAPRERPDGTENRRAELTELMLSRRGPPDACQNQWTGLGDEVAMWSQGKWKCLTDRENRPHDGPAAPRVCTLRCGDVSRCSSSFSSVLIGPLCSSSATCPSKHTHGPSALTSCEPAPAYVGKTCCGLPSK